MAVILHLVGAQDVGCVDHGDEALRAEHQGVVISGRGKVVLRMQDVLVETFEPEGQAAEVAALLNGDLWRDLGGGQVLQFRGLEGEVVDAVETEDQL